MAFFVFAIDLREYIHIYFPVFRNGILVFGAFNDRWGGNVNLKISKTKMVSSEKYLEYRTKYEETIDKITKYVNDKKIFDEQLLASTNEIVTLQSALLHKTNEFDKKENFNTAQLDQLTNKLKDWQRVNSIEVLDGEWFLKISKETINAGIAHNSTSEYFGTIKNGHLKMRKENQSMMEYYIVNRVCNYSNLIVQLSMHPTGVGAIENEWRFTLDKSNFDILNGTGRDNTSIGLRRKISVSEHNSGTADGSILE
ncbi:MULTISPECIES: hypothetical protein [unclassified Mucilaginibacter]|uniref:hypothetical protein n=1 Tax=unclassified Mucilaginibacter TaxID=2617802 RepID=UPI002AC8E873|nr:MULTISPECIES: hypothetical protein [unclassified Mucilaginibacter]MEB0263390.1 hypothetical protein [Mucilaginibacter sp. 10I4]MEB0278581.1 hypothetical protein [Mucilaginibacter sp. 10B2]MEB0299291.1 hypothetical protein [Mucilaginibacter sp. 5C4]WPX23464.1 hypothetical protein RHM67_19500 [Mucilaginibacter sp. 5C4]